VGQKVHPFGLRLGIIRTWNSRWFATKKTFSTLLHEDINLRRRIRGTLKQAGISKIEIERASDRVRIILYTARPGIIIGRRGADIGRLSDELTAMTKKEVHIDIKEIANPFLDAQLVGENIAFQLEKRVAFRKAMKKAVASAMNAGAGGIKITCSGRLGGAEMSRSETYKEGKIPLHTLRADIDYGFTEAHTTYGLIGVKTWIYKGDIMPQVRKESIQAKTVPAEAAAVPARAAIAADAAHASHASKESTAEGEVPDQPQSEGNA
jgi:small subunit ribosomal protein S3